ncbi:hypothetical protein QR680_004123 [Steinernema hermaphroditum]|uniref:Uncharacterized protein n=1 Tax=Steinernema hermaphroditum TaxID=289476 RepID=A0AA39LTI0_9BILA|nr:hypothetical protein QR680_004123 [Steinernema hermaphroditum]
MPAESMKHHFCGCIHVKHVVLIIGILSILGGTFGFMHVVPRHRGNETITIAMIIVFSSWILCGGLTLWGVVLERPKLLIPLGTCQFIHFLLDIARIGVFLGEIFQYRRVQEAMEATTTARVVWDIISRTLSIFMDLLAMSVIYYCYWYLKDKKDSRNERLSYVQYTPFQSSNMQRRPSGDLEAGPAEEDPPPDYESCVAGNK